MDTSNTDHGRIYKSVRDDGAQQDFDLWDSLESDTESLVQEKAYQRAIHKRILDRVVDPGSSYNDTLHNIGRSEHEKGQDPQPDPSESSGDQKNTLSRQMPLNDYDDLRYDPDWRKKLPESPFLQRNLNYKDPEDTLGRTSHKPRAKRHEYLVVHSPVLSEIDTLHPMPPQSSFHVYPQQDEDTVISVPQSLPSSLKSTPHFNSDKIMKVKQEITPRDEENQGIVQSSEKVNAVAMQKRLSQKSRPDGPKEDIVERNIATLGMNWHKQGSYLKAYKQKEENLDNAFQSVEDTASSDRAESPDNAPNLEMMWIQKTQKLKSHNRSKHLGRARPEHHRAKPSGPMNQPEKKRHSQTTSENQTLSQPDFGGISHCSLSSAPTINLNINLNSSANVAEPLIISEPQKQLYTLVLPPVPQSETKNDAYNSHLKRPSNTLCPPLPPAGFVDHETIQATNKKNSGSYPTRSPRQESSTSNDRQLVVFEEKDLARTLQTYGGVYPVLPPIDGSNNSDLCAGRPEEAANTIYNNSSEGYLAQFAKQKLIQAKTTYKAYTLKDYKSLNLEVKLGGLGKSNKVATDVTEKIRQQKLYSNVIREQNKKISRIPSAPTRNVVGNDNKNNVPRNKALEYAKTIAKPKAAAQQLKKRSIDKPEQEKVFEHSAYLQLGVDLTQLSTLEMLKKRHEQEKQAVARFTNIHDNSSASSFSSH